MGLKFSGKITNLSQQGKGNHAIATEGWLRGEKIDVLLKSEEVDYAMETQDFFCHPRF